MKIVHICMAAPYVDGWGYQENLLPKYLSEKGVESVVIASNILPSFQNNKQVKLGEYMYDGTKIIRLSSKRYGSSLTYARGLYETLEKENPDAIFHHNINFLSHIPCAKYCIKHKIPMFEDNHADYINCIKNHFKRFIFYKCINGFLTNLYSKPVAKFYGVTHSRCRFLWDVYGINKKKVDFLPIGADVNATKGIVSKEEIRVKLLIQPEDVVIASGGKMGVDKGTDSLINAIDEINRLGRYVKLILFGKFSDKETEDLAKSKPFVKIFGWCDRTATLELLTAADFACWPIHHTTLCEDSIACKTPLLIRKTETTEHLIDGNGFFMVRGDKEELKSYVLKILTMDAVDKNKLNNAVYEMCNRLNYSNIAQTVIEQVSQYK